jgi:hypothetical protein
MVSQKDKELMRRRGAAMDRVNDEAIAEAARRTPGENILIGLQLGDFARAVAQNPEVRSDPVPPVRIWRALKQRRGPT